MKKLHAIFIIIGLFALSSQIILIKEFLKIFSGNELIIGIALFFWLIFSALGNGFAISCKKLKIEQPAFNINLLLVAISLPCLFFLIKIIYSAFTISAGMTLNLSLIIAACFFVFAPFTHLLGSLFTLGCSLKQMNDTGIGRIYLFEGIGALIGGLLVNQILVKFCSNFKIALLISWISLFFIFIFFYVSKQKRLFTITACLFFILMSPFILNWHFLETTYINLYKTDTVVLSSNSIYGNLSVTKQADQYNFFENGILLGSSSDLELKEEIAHYSYFTASLIKNALVIGGGFNGILHELLKHDTIEKIVYVELDPHIIKKTKPFLSINDQQALTDPSVTIEYTDGRLFLKETSKKFDLILVNLPGPLNGFLNRFYTDEFFKLVKTRLTPNGLLSFTYPPISNYMTDEFAMLCASVFSTLKDTFQHIAILPASCTLFLASNDPNIAMNAEHIITKLRDSHIQSNYLNPKLIRNQLENSRLKQIEQQIENTKAKKNYDFKPIAYFYNLIHWESAFSKVSISSKLFHLRINVWIIPLIILLLLCLPQKKAQQKISKVTLSALIITAFGTMSLELISVYLFQAIYGYAYYKIGIIFMFFMTGLALGANQATRIKESRNTHLYARIILFQIVLLTFSLLLPVIATIILKFHSFTFLQFIAFPLMNLYFGNLIGAEFCIASRLIFRIGNHTETSAAKTYSADLIGAALGALLTGSIFIPLYGITKTCMIIALFSLFSLIPLINGLRVIKEI